MVSYINKSETVDTASINILPDRTALNEKRTSFIICNTSTGGQVITLGVDAEAVANAGIVLNPGGSWSEPSGSNLPPNKRITAISDIAGGTLGVYEEAQ